MAKQSKPIVLITGSAGNVGSALKRALQDDFEVVGCDRPGKACDIEMDITSDESMQAALEALREKYGKAIAAVVHLAAYFDFSGEESPRYDAINVQGTKRLLRGLQDFKVERFIYSGTMLVHEPASPGAVINEKTPIKPKWAYPESKARTEGIIRKEHGHIPYTVLRLAGLYDEQTAVPTLSHQIARIYERDVKSHLYSGDLKAGQSFIHREDMMDVFVQAIRKRHELPEKHAILAGEPDAVGYEVLQDTIGQLIHGRDEWETLRVPAKLAKAGSWIETKSEPIVPDAIDQGEKPFIRPFMVEMASDHYALDISEARRLLGWEPRHSILETLPKLIANLKKDPLGWYEANRITPPEWMQSAGQVKQNPESIRSRYERRFRSEHHQSLWAHFLNMGLGGWLVSAPFIMGYESTAMIWSDVISGVALFILAFMALSWQASVARWGCAAIGLWVLFAPLVFWAPTAAAYTNGTLVGMLVIGFAVLVHPPPGVSPVAAETGPSVPPGWDYSPSSWMQRMPIIILAFVGFFISRYLAAYQLGHIDGVWEPFFSGPASDTKNGTEEIITSSVSEAWPVSDAGVGALTYALEILTGLIGSAKRWRTMPWLVLLFGFMIVPLGAVSITFIIIQPIILSTWCTLCLIAAAAMLIQIPYSFDEIIATLEFLRRRKKQGRPVLHILFTGDTDEEWKGDREEDNFEQPPKGVIAEMLGGGVTLPWNLLACIAIGIWLMFTRITLGAEGGMASADHLIGALVVTITVTALAEVMRPLRFLNVFFGMAMLITPFLFETSVWQMGAGIISGLALISFSIPRGAVRSHYGEWNRVVF